MELSLPQGQPQNSPQAPIHEGDVKDCHNCHQQVNESALSCAKCSNIYHLTCVKHPGSPGSWCCHECESPTRPESLTSTSSSDERDLSLCNRQALELKKLDEERELSEKRDREYIAKKYKILLQFEAEYSNTGALPPETLVPLRSNGSTCFHNESTITSNSALLTSSIFTTATNSLPRMSSSHGTYKNNVQFHIAEAPLHSTTMFNNINGNKNTQQQQPTGYNAQGPSNLFPNLQSFTENASSSLNNSLTTDQVHARQTVPKDLPLFEGRPEEWPLFSSTYEWSTAVCGLTNAENLIRLQRALRGDAMEAVRHILIHPSCVPHAFSTLKMLYGQPEKILLSLQNRIRGLPSINLQKMETITNFAVQVKGLQSTIEACGLLDELMNSTLVQELVSKLPPYYQISWGAQKLNLQNNNKKVSLVDFADWIFDIGLSASSVNVGNYLTSEPNQRKQKPSFVNAHEEQKKRCIICKEKCNNINSCQQFLSADRNERWNLVRKYELCKQCLRKHYGVCNHNKICNIEGCQYKHHYLLHGSKNNVNTRKSEIQNTQSDEQPVEEDENNTAQAVNTHNYRHQNVLFKIVPIIIYGNYNKSICTFAFLDDGSSISLIEEEMLRELEICGEIEPLCLKWTGNVERTEKNSQRLSIRVSGQNNQNQFLVNVRSVEHLSLPKQTLDYERLSTQFPYLRGLPIKSYNSVVPKILIGLNNANVMISKKIKEGNLNEPVAIKTPIGWTIFGPFNNDTQMTRYNFHICECTEIDANIHNVVKHFYDIENLGIKLCDSQVNTEEQRSVNLLNKFTSQREDGHYETCLLWRFENVTLPESYQMAKKRLMCLEKKLLSNKELFTVFTKTIEDYKTKSFIRKVDKLSYTSSKIWYLPIFPVFNKNKPGKCRIVWDAAAKSNGVSLNSMLYKGPDLLCSLLAILFKFREKSVAICGDIEQMFHQIYIREEDRQAQRFLWRNCDNRKEPEIYVMNVMIFGASCAPCISQFVKNKNASKFENQFPEAAAAVKNNHYVDDFLYSTDSTEQAIKIARDVRHIQKQAGLNLRNWMSNKNDVVNALEDTKPDTEISLNIGSDNQIEKVLGIFWNATTDIITFKISPQISSNDIISGNKRPTKREILKILMTIYDPLGLVGHFLMFLKIVLQQIWRSGVSWDEPIKEDEFINWRKWVQYLPDIEMVNIKRCYLQTIPNYTHTSAQLHVFVDASENGYAAVAYLRLICTSTIVCSLVGSKTRVAPLKVTSIPRLELLAALIGARFADTIIQNHSIKINTKYFWSDSRTVLSWLTYSTRKYHQFVALRVSEILDTTELKEWHWIPGKCNVADEATKWTKKPDISPSGRWFQGPEFLLQPESEWPDDNVVLNPPDLEVKQSLLIHSYEDSLIEAKRFSKWERLLRTTSYVLRFCSLLKNKNSSAKATTEFSSEEITKAEIVLFKQAQTEIYSEEINLFKKQQRLPKSSPLFKANVVLDVDGVLRVESRLEKANLSQDSKHPTVLPRNNHITHLLITYYHTKFHHLNHESVVNELRQRFYVPRLRTVVKSVIRSCQSCKIHKATPKNPQMAQLPDARLASFCPPFTYTGVDYFGPMMVTVNRHTEKRYAALFTCLTVRAVHIEVVNFLNTSSCIMAVRNFICRRGTPREFYSDNGTNFVSTEKELREATKEIDKNELVREFTTTITRWNFIPPSSPHMGGAWERLVRSVKTILYKMTPTRLPSEELLRAMLLEVENIINSRPLTYVPIDNDNAEALTPNHFLLGSSNGMKPLANYEDSGVALKHTWLYSQKFAENFWRRWIKEYLPTLTYRSKWHEKSEPIKVGDLVIVVDPSNPRNVWPRGKVLEAIKAKDGQVRRARVLTSSGIVMRPATRLAVLDVAQS